jgi:hypothetical protein
MLARGLRRRADRVIITEGDVGSVRETPGVCALRGKCCTCLQQSVNPDEAIEAYRSTRASLARLAKRIDGKPLSKMKRPR